MRFILLTCIGCIAAIAGAWGQSPQIIVVPVPVPRHAPPPRTVTFFASHPWDMQRTLAVCRDNPGSMAAECQNARAAETRTHPPQWPSFPRY